MRRIGWLLTLLFPLSLFAQYPDVDAVREVLLAKDFDTVLKHVPSSLQKAIAELPLAERNELARVMVVNKNFERNGKLVPGTTPEILVRVEPPEGRGHPLDLVIEKRISDGSETLLRIMAHSDDPEEHINGGAVLVWMRYEEGEWRVYELTASEENEIANLADPKFLAQIRHSRQDGNESSCVGSLRSINTALVTYASTYPNIGYSSSLDALGGGGYTQPSPQHAMLLDQVLTSAPYEKSGYRFVYRPDTSKSPVERYTVIAIPTGERVEGQRSFFTDQSGVIRFTQEDREADATDKPLQ